MTMYKRSGNAMVLTVYMCGFVGGMQRSPEFYEMILQTYTNKGDLVLQFYADDGTLAEKARQHERHILIVEVHRL